MTAGTAEFLNIEKKLADKHPSSYPRLTQTHPAAAETVTISEIVHAQEVAMLDHPNHKRSIAFRIKTNLIQKEGMKDIIVSVMHTGIHH